MGLKADEISQQVRVPARKPDDLISIVRTHVKVGKRMNSQKLSSYPYMHAKASVYTHRDTHRILILKNMSWV